MIIYNLFLEIFTYLYIHFYLISIVIGNTNLTGWVNSPTLFL